MPRPSANDIATGALPKISHGRGVYLWDTDGRQYIDGSGGPAVFSVGHGDPRVNKAVAEFHSKGIQVFAHANGDASIDMLIDAVRAGAGIGYGFEDEVRPELDAGALVPLLQPWWATFPGFYLYYPSRAQMPRKLRAFIDFMQPRTQA